MPRLAARAAAALLALVVLAAAGVAAPARAQDRAGLGEVAIYVFLEKSGRFSVDISKMADFSAGQFSPMGPGIPEGERFDSIFIRVELTAPKEIFAKGPQATVTVTHSKTKRVISRTVLADVYVGPERRVYKGVYVDRVGCAPMDIVVQAGAKRFARSLPVHCGE
jgi:hypothetical protein